MKKKPISNKSQTDFERLDKMQDEDIDFSDAPEITPEMFAKAIVRHTPSQMSIYDKNN